MTSNARKLQEYQLRFSQYGIAVTQTPKDESLAAELLQKPGAFAVLRERSALFHPDGARLTGFEDLAVAINRTTLTAIRPSEDGALSHHRYERKIEGHIDLSKRRAEEDVFDWDDIFVSRSTLSSYHEMRERGLKLSARDLVISDFVQEHLWYEERINLRWTPVSAQRSVQFSLDPIAFIDQHAYYRMLPSEHPLRAILDRLLEDGLFFRSAKNRREKNYWMPGLNAGVPLVPKLDDVHEATFMFHDLMHFAFPDLLFDGQISAAHRAVYIAHRMMSEAFTLVLADMVFIETLAQRGVDYDFDKRRIHPLLRSLSRELLDALSRNEPEALATLLHANTRYCLLGDEAPYLSLGADRGALDRFRAKYEQFFIADYEWTANNFASMAARMGDKAQAWMTLVSPVIRKLPFQMTTVSEALRSLTEAGVNPAEPEALVEGLFERYRERLWSLLQGARGTGEELRAQCRTHGFKRYAIGQSAAFVTFDFLPESAHYSERLLRALETQTTLTLEDVQKYRGFMDQFFDILCDRKLLSDDDRDTYKEVYPFFSPCYVAYDVKPTEQLKVVSRKILLGG